MAIETLRVTYSETTVALMNSVLDGFIDDFYASIDANYTPSAMNISLVCRLTIQNAGATERVFRSTFDWYEDAATINTRIKAVLAGFTDGITVMEGASSYTTVQTLAGTAILTITYA